MQVRVIGISVRVEASTRPVVRLVVLDDSSDDPTVERVEEVAAQDVGVVEQLFDASRTIESRLRALKVQRVVVRRADVPPRPSNREAPRQRLLMEGAATAAARVVVTETRLGMGRELAQWCGTVKEDLDNEAVALVTSAGHHAKFGEAAAAALAALRS